MLSRPDPRSDADLLVDPGAVAVLYRRHDDGLLRCFRRRGLRADNAIDFSAETFAVALQSTDRNRPGP